MKNKVQLFLTVVIICCMKIQSQVTTDTLINLGKHKLHFKIIKGNSFPIIFEAGNGNDGSVWEPILQSIHKKTGATLITYDWAGLGKSEIDSTKISFKGEVEDLKKALKKMGYDKEYFLVAHSFGSFYTSEFNHINKGEIKGAVFIYASTPCMFTEDWTLKYKNNLSLKV